LVAIVEVGSPIVSTAELHAPGTRITVQAGTTSDLMTEWYLPQAEIVRLRTATDTILELNAGRADAIIIDRGVAEQFLDDHDNLRLLPETLAYEEYAIAVGLENTELLGRINDALQQLMDSGELQRIYEEFFGGE
jgi:ABC-type amino acid transport substrate-binding protein